VGVGAVGVGVDAVVVLGLGAVTGVECGILGLCRVVKWPQSSQTLLPLLQNSGQSHPFCLHSPRQVPFPCLSCSFMSSCVSDEKRRPLAPRGHGHGPWKRRDTAKRSGRQAGVRAKGLWFPSPFLLKNLSGCTYFIHPCIFFLKKY
jgi:hypothetical protein